MLRYLATSLLLLIFVPNALPLSSMELTGPVAIVSNDIDIVTAESLRKSLESMEFEVEIFSPDELAKALSFAQFVILLGGHKAPGGIGDLVAPLLSGSEKANLEKKGYAYYFIRKAWGKYFVIIAGNDRFCTYRASNTFIVRGIRELRSYMQSPSIALVIVPAPMGG